MLTDWLTERFKLEEINGERCPTYLYRWRLLKRQNYQIYIHRIVGDDWTRDLHDHPKRFLSIGLYGGYIEETPKGERKYQAPWLRSFPATHIHRLRVIGRVCWTLVIVFKPMRQWGFWHNGQWVQWETYVGSDAADRRKNCP